MAIQGIEEILLTSSSVLRKQGESLYVGHTRITLDTVVAAHHDGASPTEIVARYPSLSPAEVAEALALYERYRPQLIPHLNQRRKNARALRDHIESEFPTDDLRTQLRRRAHDRFANWT